MAEEEAAVDTSDVSAQVARLSDAEPDAVLVSSVGGGFEVLAQNTLFQQMQDTTRFSLAAIGNQPDSWELANPGALEGLIFMGSLNPENELTNELRDFLEPKRDDDWAMTAYDAQAWDAIHILAEAIETAGTADDPAAINAAIQQTTDYEAHFGQPGFTLSYAADKHVGTDGLCGLSLIQFDGDNQPRGPVGRVPARVLIRPGAWGPGESRPRRSSPPERRTRRPAGGDPMTEPQLWFSVFEVGCFYGLIALGYLLILEGAGFFNFALGPFAMVAGLVDHLARDREGLVAVARRRAWPSRSCWRSR